MVSVILLQGYRIPYRLGDGVPIIARNQKWIKRCRF